MIYVMKSILILLITAQVARVIAIFDGEIVELNCSDNATCIDGLARNLIKNLKEDKAVKLLGFLTIEPIKGEPAENGRSNPGILAKFLGKHAISFDIGPYLLRLTKAKSVPAAVAVDVIEGRNMVQGEEGRRRNRRVMHMLLPLMLGIKTTGMVVFAIGAVALLTFKAFFASKLALLVTGAMAAKRLLENFNGLNQNQPYLYSQYPIDFPNSGSHGYAMGSGGNPNYAAQEVYSPSALASHSDTNSMLQQNDATAQQSQQSLHIINATRASDRWDDMWDAADEEGDEEVELPLCETHIKQKCMSPPKSEGINNSPVLTKRYKSKLIDLNRLKNNKGFTEYLKIKKYHHDFNDTFYKPKINYHVPENVTNSISNLRHFFNENVNSKAIYSSYEDEHSLKRISKRSATFEIEINSTKTDSSEEDAEEIPEFSLEVISNPDVQTTFIKKIDKLFKSGKGQEYALKAISDALFYGMKTMYGVGVELVAFSLYIIDGIVSMSGSVFELLTSFNDSDKRKGKRNKKKATKKQPSGMRRKPMYYGPSRSDSDTYSEYQ